MRSALAALALAAGCGRLDFDAAASAPSDAGTDAVAILPTFFDPSLVPVSSDDAVLSGLWTYDTTTGTLADGMLQPYFHESAVDSSREPPVRIASFHGFRLEGTLLVHGTMPLAIVATTTLVIGGLLDASGGNSEAGPGAVACTDPPGDGASDTGGAGGGGGGGFGAVGGNGGNGDNDQSGAPLGPGLGGTGGGAEAVPTSLRGGCNGARGGSGVDPGGAHGFAGGAVLLYADDLEVTGTLDLGGSGGLGCPVLTAGDCGGGGGASGGMGVMIATSAMQLVGTIAANGGAGAEGSSSFENGDSGGDGSLMPSPAAGGSLGTASIGDNGGVGGYSELPAGGDSDTSGGSSGGGGGGGGSVGWLFVSAPPNATISQFALSPDPTAL